MKGTTPMDGANMQMTLEKLISNLRPRLHRYCARMMGSAFDGEDVVQDALAKAAEAYGDGSDIERPENWLFRIAHNAALDALRKRNRLPAFQSDFDLVDETMAGADARLATEASFATLLALPVVQRSSVILADVLGYSLVETGDILAITLPATKAALHRARAKLKELAAADMSPPVAIADEERERLRAYAERFNARDFDALRALLAEDVRLDLVNRTRLAGRKDVSVYFTRYSSASDWHFNVGIVEGRAALLVDDPSDPSGGVAYVVLLDWADGKIAGIRDFKYAPYVMDGLAVAPL
jgi:RNA polymerase sigma-70 factor (ECF subfamily)